jgi:hypothetical protein
MAEETVKVEKSEFSKHMRAATKARAKQVGSLVPKEFWQYGREARREFLLAMRSVVDDAIDHLEAKGTGEAPPAKPKPKARKTRVVVEEAPEESEE